MLRPPLVCAWCLAVGCAPDLRPRPEIRREDITIRVGPHNTSLRGSWTAVEIRARNRGETFQGTLEVRGRDESLGGDWSDRVLYRQTVEIPGGGQAPRQLQFPVYCQGWTHLTLSLHQPGFAVSFDHGLVRPPGTDTMAPPNIAVFGEAVPALDALAGNPWRPHPATGAEIAPVLSPRSLPVEAAALSPYCLVILHNTTLDGAPDGALNALRRWVERGGTLLVIPGPSWAGGLPPPLAQLLAVERGGGVPPPELVDAYGTASAGAYYAGILPTGEAAPILGGLAVEAAVGTGAVVTLAFGPVGEVLPALAEAPGLHAALSEVHLAALERAEVKRRLRAIERNVESELRRMASFHVPPRSTAVWGLALYLACGFFVPGVICRRLRRPEWTYAILIVVAASLTLLIYRHRLLSALPGAELEEITVLRVHAGGRSAEATSFVGVMSPRATGFSFFDAGAPGAERNPLFNSLPRPRLERRGDESWAQELLADSFTIDVDPGGRLCLGAIAVPPNELRCARFDYTVGRDRIPGDGEPLTPGTSFLGNLAAAVAPDTGVRGRIRLSPASVFPGAGSVTRRHAWTLIVEPGQRQ